jgi:hypothetical protein
MACAHKSEIAAEQFEETGTMNGNAPAEPAPFSIASQPKMIRTANYRFEVTDVKKTTAFIEETIQKYPAHIAKAELLSSSTRTLNEITIRVQSDYFDAILRDIDSHATQPDHRNVQALDVGKEFVDLEARLKTKLEVKERYTTILRTKAATVEDILAAERQIGNIQEEIEAAMKRLAYLRDQVTYSTIHLEFYQYHVPAPVAIENGFIRELTEAFIAGWKGVVAFIVAITYLWPVLLLGAGAFVFYIRRRRRMSGAT